MNMRTSSTPFARSDAWWVGELEYIERVALLNGAVAEMRGDPETFLRYCQMQLDAANTDSRPEVADRIQALMDTVSVSQPSDPGA